MKTDDRILVLAGFAAAAVLVLGSASMTIALIAAAYPPVSEYSSAAFNARLATQVRWMCIVPALSLLISLWALAQVVLRRPLMTSVASAERWPVANPWILVAVTIPAVVLCMYSFFTGMASISAGGARPATDNLAFAGLSLPLGGAAIMGFVLSSTLFLRWWKGTLATELEPAGDQIAPRPT